MSYTMPDRSFPPAPMQMRQRRVIAITTADHDDLIGRIEGGDGFQVETSPSYQSGFALAVAQANSQTLRLDAILICVDLPDGCGIELCARLRDRGVNSPILMLSNTPNEATVVRGLDAGANDFLHITQRPAEMRARLRAQIRAFEISDDAVLEIGEFQFRPARRLLEHRRTSERVRLTEKEAAVLKFLYRADAPVTRNTLLHEVWGYSAGATTHTVETHIYRLRRKIEPDSTQIGVLVNEGGGYRLRLRTAETRAELLADEMPETMARMLPVMMHAGIHAAE